MLSFPFPFNANSSDDGINFDYQQWISAELHPSEVNDAQHQEYYFDTKGKQNWTNAAF